MSVIIKYECGCCFIKQDKLIARITKPLFMSEERFRVEGGFCSHSWPTIEQSLPDGWGICLIGCVYCPACLLEVNAGDSESNAKDHLPPRVNNENP